MEAGAAGPDGPNQHKWAMRPRSLRRLRNRPDGLQDAHGVLKSAGLTSAGAQEEAGTARIPMRMKGANGETEMVVHSPPQPRDTAAAAVLT